MNEINLKQIKRKFVFAASIFAMLAMLSNPSVIMESVKSSLKVCISSLVPAIFPFMVAAAVFINSLGKNTFEFLSPLLKLLFGISSSGAAALIPGIICGYPIGADCACKLYKNKMISKSEAESLIAYSNNSGPMFIIGAVGTAMLSSVKTGIVLYIIHIMSSLICGIALKPFTKSEKIKSDYAKNSKDFTESVCDSTLTILKICGFVVIFAVINAILSPLLEYLPKLIKYSLCSILELTNGISEFSSVENEKLKAVFISASLGWSGLSVHMQVKSITSPLKLSMKKYYAAKVFSCFVSALMSYISFTKIGIANEKIFFDYKYALKILTAVSAFITCCLIIDMYKKKKDC